MLRFFLDKGKEDEQDLIEEVNSLKQERQFAPTVRDGLRLMRDLRAGRFDALFDLFDWIPQWIEAEVERRINERMTTTDARLAALEAQIASLKATPAGGPKAMSVPAVPLPEEDDTALLSVRKTASDGAASANNFLMSAFRLVQ